MEEIDCQVDAEKIKKPPTAGRKKPYGLFLQTDPSEVKRLIFLLEMWSKQPGGIDLDEQVREA